ncbi:TolC family protein [Jejuia pallidilutea]|uniref:Multidrug efflux protein outer membrane component n=1 Tax=Jejuia pallidilutea TaxID=504487 RepID=A0A090VRH3_9FLAO|nr:TolC family protein [Jejuia pallidilutea]GAL66588.1 multidrug efflux protein outer membrane component [Jejuia pallidilutea]GAL69851.1 multidrug efflux protein outer membrane component [Jejuia pallidilutea]GAL90887.1 multidrug efflux protein outer membrane component [Jejuia pallidilutea]
MRVTLICIILCFSGLASAQDSTSVISLAEYLGYVKSYHPIVKQANLVINESEAKLMKARGAFDPKLEVDYDRKKFKNTEYFDRLNATFKIPTWFGVEFKGNFEENTGDFLNPQAFVPEDGLYSAGVSVPVARGLLTNKRMAMLRQSRLYVKQAQADRQLLVNNILYEATVTYFNWLRRYNEKRVFEDFLTNAEIRFNGIKKSYEVGDMPAIDTLEARITLNNRRLNLEKSRIKFIKASLELSNFLWLNDNTPIELKDNVIPDVDTFLSIDETLNTSGLDIESFNFENHPKLQSLDYKIKSLDIEKRLKANNLLPQIDLQYNFLSETPDVARSFSTSAYKSGVNIYFPLFLRKERGDLKLAKLKLQDTRFEVQDTRVSLRNKIDAISQELDSYIVQSDFTEVIVNDYATMLSAEERKFFLGESSLFLVNSRESKLIDAKLKAIEIENDFLKTKANLFNVLALE